MNQQSPHKRPSATRPQACGVSPRAAQVRLLWLFGLALVPCPAPRLALTLTIDQTHRLYAVGLVAAIIGMAGATWWLLRLLAHADVSLELVNQGNVPSRYALKVEGLRRPHWAWSLGKGYRLFGSRLKAKRGWIETPRLPPGQRAMLRLRVLPARPWDRKTHSVRVLSRSARDPDAALVAEQVTFRYSKMPWPAYVVMVLAWLGIIYCLILFVHLFVLFV